MGDSFRRKLEKRVDECNSLLCIGLDPHLSQLSIGTAEAAKDFCLNIIEATHPYAACYKPNIAFFECFGEDGISSLISVVSAIPKDIPVILDSKRGDIDSTAQAYAQASFQAVGTDSVTLNPYMGWDSVQPFITGENTGRGVFVLCKTSNTASSDIQLQRLDNGKYLFEHVLELCLQWQEKATNSFIGVVAGATDVGSLRIIRQKAPDIWILCPGVGAQGGDLHEVCPAGLRADGSGLLVSVSRAISKAENMAAVALALRDQINLMREQRSVFSVVTDTIGDLYPYQRQFIAHALDNDVLQFGSFTLKSGRVSPYFFNAGNMCGAASISTVGRCYAQAVRAAGLQFDIVFGPAYKGIPLATAFIIAWFEMYGESKDISYNRKEVKDHGEGGMLVGASTTGKQVLIIDDVITAGTAIHEAVSILSHAGAVIVGVVVSLDREEKASDSEILSATQRIERDYHFPVLSIIRLRDLITYLKLSSHSIANLADHLPDMESYRSLYGV